MNADGGGDEGGAPKSSAAQKGKRPAKQKKRPANESSSSEHPDSKVLKKARPSISKAAEELVCPILHGLPIDPVTAEDVSQGRCKYFAALDSDIALMRCSIIYLFP